jgi:hypothetical protein
MGSSPVIFSLSNASRNPKVKADLKKGILSHKKLFMHIEDFVFRTNVDVDHFQGLDISRPTF